MQRRKGMEGPYRATFTGIAFSLAYGIAQHRGTNIQSTSGALY